MFQKIIRISVLIALSGCADGGHWMSSEYLIGRGWAKPPEQKAKTPLYCYRTLGDVNCYRSPQKGKGKLIEPVPTEVIAENLSQESPDSTSDDPISLKGQA